jgi:DNA-binding NtrC family response regulator
MQQQQNFERLVDYLLEGGFFLQEAVEIIERTLIARVLERTGGNCSAASKQLGIHRNTLQKKIAYFKLERKPPQKAKAIRRRSAAAS